MEWAPFIVPRLYGLLTGIEQREPCVLAFDRHLLERKRDVPNRFASP
jgi:hypothetical protein